MTRLACFLLTAILVSSCSNTVEIDFPAFSDTILAGTVPLTKSSTSRMEGVYIVVEGQAQFGETVALKWSGDLCSIFSGTSGGYLVFQAGSQDSTILLEGTWRYSVSTETGLTRMSIAADEGGDRLIADTSGSFDIILRGTFGHGDSHTGSNLVLRYERRFAEVVRTKPYWILAHRGGGRNSDYVGASENSLEMISLAERFGANGIEIDVKLSRDGVAFLYHDPDINLRLTQKGPLVGDVEDFTWAQLRTFVLLKNGEKIPTLSEALDYVFDETNLRFVWLDMKSDRNAMPSVMAIQQEFLSRPLPPGRDSLEILIGLPTTDQIDFYLGTTGYSTHPALCELSLNDVRRTNAGVWAPRWTEGTLDAGVSEVHAEGRRAFVWTLDVASFIREFVQTSQFDGILTNYPTIVAYYHYTR
ncbi:MAG: glycerophosphodiester phosphodiesterase family protein [Ignavibacteria bacterium]|nr:glycerophosphodiester phosphodiesterase family protein [Ignavibacteria bacterium]